MAASGYFIDANLLLLLIVGNVGRDLISKHRRLQMFTANDYDLLLRLLQTANRAFVTPSTLTEASNLLAQHGDPERSLFFHMLRHVIVNSEEVSVASRDAASNRDFIRLGLTDAALLEVIDPDTPLITVDMNLYLAGSSTSPGSVLDFTYLQHPDDGGSGWRSAIRA